MIFGKKKNNNPNCKDVLLKTEMVNSLMHKIKKAEGQTEKLQLKGLVIKLAN